MSFRKSYQYGPIHIVANVPIQFLCAIDAMLESLLMIFSSKAAQFEMICPFMYLFSIHGYFPSVCLHAAHAKQTQPVKNDNPPSEKVETMIPERPKGLRGLAPGEG